MHAALPPMLLRTSHSAATAKVGQRWAWTRRAGSVSSTPDNCRNRLASSLVCHAQSAVLALTQAQADGRHPNARYRCILFVRHYQAASVCKQQDATVLFDIFEHCFFSHRAHSQPQLGSKRQTNTASRSPAADLRLRSLRPLSDSRRAMALLRARKRPGRQTANDELPPPHVFTSVPETRARYQFSPLIACSIVLRRNGRIWLRPALGQDLPVWRL
jgi:hypothetical protein